MKNFSYLEYQLLGHEAIGVYYLLCKRLKEHKIHKDHIKAHLFVHNYKSINRLRVWGLIDIKENHLVLKDSKPITTLKEVGDYLSEATIQKQEAKRIDWLNVFIFGDLNTKWLYRGRQVDSIDVGIIHNHALFIINKNTVYYGKDKYEKAPNTYESLYAHKEQSIPDDWSPKNPIKVDLIPAPIATVTDKRVQYDENVDLWNASKMSQWIIDQYNETFEVSCPFSPKKLTMAGLPSAIDSLWSKSDKKINKNRLYKKFVFWLFNHRFYDPTISNLTSTKIIEHYLVNIHKQKAQKTKENIPDVYNA